MLYVPRHLPNRLEYKVLSCISVHYQSRMTSNEIASTPPYPLTVQAGQWYYSRLICVGGRGVSRSSSGGVNGDLVDAAVWGIVPCVSKIYSVLYVGTLWMLLLVDLRSIR